MQLLVLSLIGEGSRPGILVGHTVEIGITSEAPTDLNQQGSARRETEHIVSIQCHIIAACLGTGSRWVDRIAIFKVPNFIGEGDAIGVRRPGHSRMLTRGRVHGMKISRDIVSGGIAIAAR